jgi:hypothetical protein
MLINHTNEPRLWLLSRYDMDTRKIEITLAERLMFSGDFFPMLRCTYLAEKLVDDVIAPFASFVDRPVPSGHSPLSGNIVALEFMDDESKVKRRVQLSRQDAREFVDCLDQLLIAFQRDEHEASARTSTLETLATERERYERLSKIARDWTNIDTSVED